MIDTSVKRRAVPMKGLGFFVSVVLSLSLLPAAGCHKDSIPQGNSTSFAGTSTKPQGSAKVTLRPEVKTMETNEALETLRGQSSDGFGFVFDPKNEKAKALRPGDVLLIKGLLARKVIVTDTTKDGVVVLTTGASIADVVKDGHLSIHAPMRFSAARASRTGDGHWRELFRNLLPSTVQAAQLDEDGMPFKNDSDHPKLEDHDVDEELHPSSMTSKVIDKTKEDVNEILEHPYVKPFKGLLEDWDVDWEATPQDGKLELNLTMSKNVNGLIAKITGKGHLSDFDFVNDMDISSASSAVSALKQAAGQFKNVNGQMDFTWEIGKDTPGPGGEEQLIKLPGAISQSLAPLLDGLPLTLEVSAAIDAHPMMTAGKQYSQGSFHVTYDGYQQFKFNNGSFESDGEMDGGPSADLPRNLSAVAPFGVVVGFAAPRIELVFGGPGIIKADEFEKAAKWTDAIVDQVGKRLLTDSAYQTYKESGFSFSKAAKAFDETNVTLGMRVVTTSTMTESGMSQITPCSRSDVDVKVYVGASASALGLASKSMYKTVMTKEFEHIEPPSATLCKTWGT